MYYYFRFYLLLFIFGCAGSSLLLRLPVAAASGGLLLVVVRGLFLLWSRGSIVVAHKLCCSKACGIFPDQGSNPCSLHWQVDSLTHRATWEALGYYYLRYISTFVDGPSVGGREGEAKVFGLSPGRDKAVIH